MENPVFTRLARPVRGLYPKGGFSPSFYIRSKNAETRFSTEPLFRGGELRSSRRDREQGAFSDRLIDGSGEARPQDCRCRWLLTLRPRQVSGVRRNSADSKKSTLCS